MAVKKINSLNAHQNPTTNENEFDIENYLNENWDTIIDVVDNNADELTELNDKSDINIQSLQTEISELEEDVKANSIIITTEEATSLQINDANGARAKLSVKGNYRQETSEESDNWLDASLFSNETKNGVTLTKQSDGSILLNGTATNSVSFLEKLKRSIRNTDGSHFLKIGKISGTLNGTVYTYLTNSDSSKSTGTPTLTSSNSRASTSIASDVEYTNCLLVVNSGTVLNNVKIYIEVCSSEVDTYIPFTPEKPSKQYPSKIEVVGGNTNIEGITIDKTFYPKLEKGEKATSYSRPGQAGVTITKFNKNLSNLDFNNKVNSSEGIQDIVSSKETLSFTLKANSSEYACIQYNNIFSADVIKKFKNKKLIASCDIEGGEKTSIRLSKNNLGASAYNIGSIEKGKTLEFTMTEDINNVAIFVYGSQGVQSTSDIKCKFSNFMIREVGTTEEYTEHQEERTILDIQQEMLKDDYFDLERGKEVHHWKGLELTGDENWRYEAHVEGKKTIIMKITIDPALDINSGVCTHFDYIGDYSLDEEHCYAGMSGTLFVFVDYSVISTVEEFKAFLAEQATAGTPVKVYYKTAETTELDLTETQIEQLEQLNKLRTYKEQTNIVTVEDVALMQLEYSADIQKYIDNKLANINQQILNLAGGN